MTMFQTGLLIGGIGVLLTAAGAAYALWWRAFLKRAIRTEGTVTAMDPGSSGEFPVITFTAEGEPMAGGRVITFRSNFSAGSYAIGQRVAVTYDPRNPRGATIMGQKHMWLFAACIGGTGLVMVPVAAMLGLWLAPLESGRDEAIEKFLAAVRRDDPRAIQAWTAQNAQIDHAYLRSTIRPSRGFRPGSSYLNSGDSCIRGSVDPGALLALYLVVEKDKWRVMRAGRVDPECDADLD
jgi:hypothetical protein